MTNKKFELPQSINSYRKRLVISYVSEDLPIHQEILDTATIFVRTGVSYDNYDGGVYGHDVILFVSESVLYKTGDLSFQNKLIGKLKEDFNSCVAISDEFIENVSLELFDLNNPNCRNGIPPIKSIAVDPQQVKVWKPGHIRLFISHKVRCKKEATQLAQSLESYGVSCFVAHDAIEPLSEWQDEIWKALASMDVLLAFITDDFSEGDWTNQEIGVALGRRIPIIPLKLENKDPYGFIAKYQVIKGNLKDLPSACNQIISTIAEKIDSADQIKTVTIESFVSSKSYAKSVEHFQRLICFETFTEKQIDKMIVAFENNSQLYDCYYLSSCSRFTNFLYKHTGKKFQIANHRVQEVA